MTLTETLALFAIIATIAAALLQPYAQKWLSPRQKLRIEITASQFKLPELIASEMQSFYYKNARRISLKAEFGEFIKNASHYESYVEIEILNIGSTVASNITLTCNLLSKYVVILVGNESRFFDDQREYRIGSLQPNQRAKVTLWSSSYIPTYEDRMHESFVVRDDHSSPVDVLLKRFYDKQRYILIDRGHLEGAWFAIKGAVIFPIVIVAALWLISSIAPRIWHALFG